jgi:hypothetical protein
VEKARRGEQVYDEGRGVGEGEREPKPQWRCFIIMCFRKSIASCVVASAKFGYDRSVKDFRPADVPRKSASH